MPRTRPPVFPELEKQIIMHGIHKADIANTLGITPKSLSRRLTGQSEFTLREIERVAAMFPGMQWETIFERTPYEQGAVNTPPEQPQQDQKHGT